MKRGILFLVIILFFSIGLSGQTDSLQREVNYSLMDVAYKGKTDSVLYWLQSGAEVDARNAGSQETALMYAAQQGHLDIVKILLENGADPNLEPRNNEEALIRAVATGQQKVAEELIRYGAKLQQTGNLDKTPLHYAAGYGFYYIVDMLIYYGAEIDNTARNNVTPLLLCISAGYPSVAELLIRNGADLNIANNQGMSPLMLAAHYNMVKLVKLLLKKGARINAESEENNTALSMAIRSGNPEIADTLIRAGANVNHRLNENMSILTYSKIIGVDTLTDILKANGASQNAKPYFDHWMFRYGINANTDDAIFGTHFAWHEVKTNMHISLGFSARYWAQQVWEEQSDNHIYQYWERRFVFPLSIDKFFNLSYNYQKQTSLFVGAKGYYTWGRYRGVNAKPDDKFGLAPRLGIYRKTSNSFAFSLHYEYLNLEQEKISPHRVVLSINILSLLAEEIEENAQTQNLLYY